MAAELRSAAENLRRLTLSQSKCSTKASPSTAAQYYPAFGFHCANSSPNSNLEARLQCSTDTTAPVGAVRKLFEESWRARLVPQPVNVEFVD